MINNSEDRRIAIKERRERLGQIQFYIDKHLRKVDELKTEKKKVKTEIVNLATFRGNV